MEPTVERVRDHGRSIIARELQRLDRRAGLTPADRCAIEHTLESVLDRVLLLRLEKLADRRPDLLPVAVDLLDPGANRLPT